MSTIVANLVVAVECLKLADLCLTAIGGTRP